MSNRYVFGVDAGGSKTRVLLSEIVDGREQRIGSANGPTGNPRAVGFELALATIAETIARAFENAGRERETAQSACFSVAGVGRRDECETIHAWCLKSGLAKQATVVGDAECLLAAVPGDGFGVTLIAGTGSMAWGCNRAGATARAGGFGYLFDDHGSGYWLAMNVLHHVCAAADARHAETSLVEAVLERLQLSSPHQLIAWCYESAEPKKQIASLAPVVFDQYACDPVACEIVNAGAVALADLVAAVAQDLTWDDAGFTLACAGSVLVKQPLYRNLLEAELARRSVEVNSIHYVDDPAVGALAIALGNL